jgi:hypothetical protein
MTMGKLITLMCAVLLSGLAAAQANGQATVIYGYASNGYATVAPLVTTPEISFGATGAPLVTTPEISFGAPVLQVGISDGAQDNASGAVNSSRLSDGFDMGASRSDTSYGAAELAARSHPRKAAKVYTNQDVAQVNDTNGLVKFGTKTEHL